MFDDYLLFTLLQGYEKGDNEEDDGNEEIYNDNEEVECEKTKTRRTMVAQLMMNWRTSSILSILNITILREVVVLINVSLVAEDFDNYGFQIVVYRAKMLLLGEWLDLPGDPIYVVDIVRLHHHDVKKQAK